MEVLRHNLWYYLRIYHKELRKTMMKTLSEDSGVVSAKIRTRDFPNRRTSQNR